MKLISEFTTNELGCIVEEKEDGKKDYKIRGVFMQSEIKNRNGRVYPPGSVEISVPLPPSRRGNQKSSSIDICLRSSLISPVFAL